ncbi:MAG: M1 family metallopeptidase [Longimicrobiales bacterium]
MLCRGRFILGVLLAGCATAAQEPSEPPAGAAVDTAQVDTTQVDTAPAGPAQMASSRPVYYTIVPPPDFEAAIERGTRTTTGRPGPRYWQNTASYTLEARLIEAQKRLEGSARIVYYNHSPDTLANLHLDLTQNLHAEGAVRSEPVEITGGVDITRLSADGRVLATEGAGPRYAVFGTRLVILPPSPIAPGDSAVLEIAWAFDIPQAGAGERMGYAGDDLFFLAYWYPQMAVYDDVVGWHPDPFLGTTEFYADFARYHITIDAPAGWIVLSTGALQNADEVFAPATRERLSLAESSDTVVTVVAAAGAADATQPGTDGRLRWRFAADSVRDVAFSVTRRSNWDAQRTPVGDRNGRGTPDYTRVDALYRDSAPLWRNAAHYAAHAIDFLSRYTGIPYPWPHMSAVEAGEIIGGGMEFPMMTLIGDYNERGDSALYYVVAHELAHMWVPMIVNTDERRYSWIDEGMTTFHENQARIEFYPGVNHELPDQESYIELALGGDEGEIMRRSAYHYDPGAYGIASYAKPATVLAALRGVLGEETFMRAHREFLQRWKYKHPYPWDLWNTFEDVAGRDLDWFWRSWYFETWTLDQAVGSVTADADGTRIVIDDVGLVPMPVLLAITLENGEVLRREIPVDSWLAGEREAVLALRPASPVVRVEIDAERAFPDADRENNVWIRR